MVHCTMISFVCEAKMNLKMKICIDCSTSDIIVLNFVGYFCQFENQQLLMIAFLHS